MRRPQFTVRALLILTLAVACFFGGIRFERERRRMADARQLEAMSLRPQLPPLRPGAAIGFTEYFEVKAAAQE